MHDDLAVEIARQLFRDDRITARQFDVWFLHRQGYTLRWMTKNGVKGCPTTLWKELHRAENVISPAVQEAEDGKARLGVTIVEYGEIVFKEDIVLTKLARRSRQFAK